MKNFKIQRKYVVNEGTRTVKRDLVPYMFAFDAEAIRNNIEARCQILRGELDYNTSLGIVLGDDQQHLDLVLSDIILNTSGVDNIESFTSSVNTSTRKYSANIVVNTVYNTQIEVVI